MQPGDQEEFDEDFGLDFKSNISIKEDILDENFKKAQLKKKGFKNQEKEKKRKKPFLKSGIALIVIAIICIALINYLPWLYIKYEPEGEHIEESYYRDFVNYNNSYPQNITGLFEPENGSSYIGLSLDDFSNIPKTASYLFISLLVLGILFTIIVLLDRLRNYSLEFVVTMHSIFSTIAIIICIYLIFILVKFLGAHFLLYHNQPLIITTLPNVILLFPVPILLIFLASGIMKTAASIMKMNYRELKRVMKPESQKKSLYTYKIRGDK
jgi:hypothetical protein